jgi:hypothetical protein
MEAVAQGIRGPKSWHGSGCRIQARRRSCVCECPAEGNLRAGDGVCGLTGGNSGVGVVKARLGEGGGLEESVMA